MVPLFPLHNLQIYFPDSWFGKETPFVFQGGKILLAAKSKLGSHLTCSYFILNTLRVYEKERVSKF